MICSQDTSCRRKGGGDWSSRTKNLQKKRLGSSVSFFIFHIDEFLVINMILVHGGIYPRGALSIGKHLIS
jgi:hypothetical protein